MPLPALRPAMSPLRTAVPTIRASMLLAALGLAASPAAAAAPADPDGWAFSGDVRGGYFASERTARDGAESDAEAFNARLPLAIERSLGERWTVRTRVAGRFSSEQRSEEHTSELQSLMRRSYAVFCLKKKNRQGHAS